MTTPGEPPRGEISREELYALVWSVSGTTLARRFRCSETYLRRVCEALDVPRPARGWWAQGEAGVAVSPPPPLPALKPGCPDRWTRGRTVRRWHRHARIRSFSPDRDLHPLVELAAHIFDGAKQSPDRTHLVTRCHDAIDVTTSAAAVESALALANALFRQLETRSHPVRVAAAGAGFIRPALDNHRAPPSRLGRTRAAVWAPRAPTITFVSGVPIGLAIVEIRRDVLKRYAGDGEFQRASAKEPVYGLTWTEWRPEPNHRFKIIAYSPHFPAPWQREWSETRRKTLVRAVAAIVAELEETARTLPHAAFFPQGR